MYVCVVCVCVCVVCVCHACVREQCTRTCATLLMYNVHVIRLSRGVPVTRLDTADRKYQCFPLRRRVLTVCQRGVELMASCTRSLVQQYPSSKNVFQLQHVCTCMYSIKQLALYLNDEDTLYFEFLS